MYFQRQLEHNAYLQGKGSVPYQLNEDFIKGKATSGYGSVKPQILGKKTGADLREVFPEFICESIIDGMNMDLIWEMQFFQVLKAEPHPL